MLRVLESKNVERKPGWLTIRPPSGHFKELRKTIHDIGLHTVCEESHCPNISECWSGGTATFMILGDICTRACKFCNVRTGYPGKKLDKNEPKKLASAVKKQGLNYVVITSVDRDDLHDQGASHFAECVKEIKAASSSIVEVLIPDFRGDNNCIKTVVDSHPDVLGHNIETVERLQRLVRDPRASYERSLSVLKKAKEIDPSIFTKSSMMLGLGEKDEEVMRALKDLRSVNVDIVTLGQYLRPSSHHLPVDEYVEPEKFSHFQTMAEEYGLFCASGPFVRSSYRAGELFLKKVAEGGL